MHSGSWNDFCSDDYLIQGPGQVFLPSEMPRSFLVKRGGLHPHRPTARSRSPEPAPVALLHSGDGTLSWDASLGRSRSESQQLVQVAGHSEESGSPNPNPRSVLEWNCSVENNWFVTCTNSHFVFLFRLSLRWGPLWWQFKHTFLTEAGRGQDRA